MGHFVSFWPLPNTPDRDLFGVSRQSLEEEFSEVHIHDPAYPLFRTGPHYILWG
jgi:hypothetical protein